MMIYDFDYADEEDGDAYTTECPPVMMVKVKDMVMKVEVVIVMMEVVDMVMIEWLRLSTSVICSVLSLLSHKRSYSVSLATGSTRPKIAKS